MFYNNINNLVIDNDLYKKILKAIRFIAIYRSDYHFKKLGFKRVYPYPATGSYFFINKKLGLMIKSSFIYEVLDNLPKKYHELVIPTIVLSYNEYKCPVSEWLIQPLADTKFKNKIYDSLVDIGADKYFSDLCKYNVGKYKNKSVIIDW